MTCSVNSNNDDKDEIVPQKEWILSAKGDLRLCAYYWVYDDPIEGSSSSSSSSRHQSDSSNSDGSTLTTPRSSTSSVESGTDHNLFIPSKSSKLQSLPHDPSALIFISHGFSEHLGYYNSLATELTRKTGSLVFGHEHAGHGLSDGERAQIDSIDTFVADIVKHCHQMREFYEAIDLENSWDEVEGGRVSKKKPLYAVAHSMGGMVILRTCIMHPNLFDGVVFQGPLIIPGPQVGPFNAHVSFIRAIPIMILLKMAAFIFGPSFVVGSNELSRITSNESVKSALQSDQLRWHLGCKLMLLFAFVDCLEENWSTLHKLKTPFFILHGSNDSLCNPKGSKVLFQHSKSEDKEIHIMKDALHQLYLESSPIKEEAVRRTVEWISKRVIPNLSEKASLAVQPSECSAGVEAPKTLSDSPSAVESNTSAVVVEKSWHDFGPFNIFQHVFTLL